MKKWLIVVIVVIIVIVAIFAIKPSNTAKLLKTVSVKRATLSENVTAIGNILPKHYTTIKSQLAGTVGVIYQNAGSYVKKGEDLLQVTPNPNLTNYAQAIANVKLDQAKLASDQKQLENFNFLEKHNVIGNNYGQLIAAQQSFNVDTETLKLDQQKLDLLEKGHAIIGGKLRQSIVASPIDGFILQRNVDVGDPVISVSDQQAATTLFTIANMDNLIFKGTVDETDAGKLKDNMNATISISALPNISINGTLTNISLQSDEQNAAVLPTDNTTAQTNSPFNIGFQVEISKLTLPKDLKLRSGYSATAEITIKTAKDALTLPERVIIFKDDKTYVELPSQNHQPNLQEVKTGISDGINIEILGGVSDGQAVIDPSANAESE